MASLNDLKKDTETAKPSEAAAANEEAEEMLSLSELAGVDISDVDEYRGEALPIGTYDFKVTDAGFVERTIKEQKVAAVAFEMEIAEVHAQTTEEPDESFVGRKHTQSFPIREIKDLGRVKAFLVDAGLSGQGVLEELMKQSVGHTFTAKITHTKDRNDPDRVYANLRFPKKK